MTGLKKIYFLSNFSVTLAGKQWDKPFRLSFFAAVLNNSVVASYDGTTYHGCHVDGNGNLVVNFTDHNLGLGPLRISARYYANAEDYLSDKPESTTPYEAVVDYEGYAVALSSEPTSVDIYPGGTGEKGEKGDKGDVGPQGPRGPQGEAGPQGAKGDKGDPGEAGPVGPQGARGPQGETGPKGEKGDKGDTGEAGPVGPQGPRGPQGENGIQGDKGEKGDQGEIGPMGSQGPVGPQGETGPQGAKGDKGDQGEIGPMGPQGPIGPQGETGPQGAKGDKGDQGEAGPQGPMGDTPLIRYEGDMQQVSYDGGRKWTNIKKFTNNLRISLYIGVDEALPVDVAEGTIVMQGPTFGTDDLEHTNPIYRMWIYSHKAGVLGWHDNGIFSSISAGVVQDTGNSATEVMSQKAVTEKFTELESKDNKPIDDAFLVKSMYEFEQGNISAEGELSTNPYRLRSKDFIELPLSSDGIALPIEIDKSSNLGYRFVYYDENKLALGSAASVDFPERTRFVKLVLNPNPDGVFKVQDLATRKLTMRVKGTRLINLLQGEQDCDERISNIEYQSTPFPAIWKSGSYYDNIAESPYRRYTIIKNVKKDEIYRFVFAGSGAWYIAIYFADEEGAFFNRTIRETSDIQIAEINGRIATEIRVTAIPVPDQTITESLWKTFDIKCYNTPKELLSERIINLENNVFGANIAYGVNYVNQTAGGVAVNYRILSDYIAVEKRKMYQITMPDGYHAEILRYNEQGGSPSSILTNYFCTDGYSYIRIYGRKTGEATIAPSEGALFMVKEADKQLHYLTISQWNVGLFNHGVSPMGIPDAEIEDGIKSVKKVLSQITSDVLFVNEYYKYVNQGDTGTDQLHTYTTLLKQFYPYQYVGGFYMAIFSKYPLSAETKVLVNGSKREYIKAAIVVGDKTIGLINAHPEPISADDRASDNNEFVAELKDYDYAIIAGDFNTGANYEELEDVNNQLEPFVNDGYTFGNRGYWGILPTYPSTGQSLDNIFAKGFMYDSYKVISEESVSDHYPSIAKLVL